MPKFKSILPYIFNAVIFIVMEIAALNMLNNNGVIQNFFISKHIHVFMAKVWGGTEQIKEYFKLRSVNEQLAKENFELNRQIQAYKIRETNMILDSLAKTFTDTSKYANGSGFTYIPATIVKISKNKQHNYIILGQGSEDGVQPHSGIITSNGVVGIVDAVGKHYSYAISFKNTELSVSTRLGKEGAVGPMVWDGKHADMAILKEIPLQYKFEVGDTVYTSGYSSIFPPDIPLGTTGDSKIVNGATYEIKVHLFQDPSSVRYVTLASYIGNNEISGLESIKEGKR